MSDQQVKCQLCDAHDDIIPQHLKAAHPDVPLDTYRQRFPDAPLLSPKGKADLEEARRKRLALAAMAGTASNVIPMPLKGQPVKRALHETFGLPAHKSLMSIGSNFKNPTMITTIEPHDQQDMVPAVSPNYVYDHDELKNVMVSLELNIPCLIWGHKGSGKTDLAEQVAARTNRPQIRVQHTRDTEEPHIIGQYVVRNGSTEFQLGPLPLAMLNGWVYLSDEYDRGMPTVLSTYQAPLEGKSLVIKEAPPQWRIIRPHPMFRFIATGNTNGSGDEHGLYPGAMIQDSANYDRFGIVIHKDYMPKEAEIEILVNTCKLKFEDAKLMVDFATKVREAFAAKRLSDTVSPRALINASRVGMMRASFREGLRLAFINKLSTVDREVADGLAQRIFGG